MSNEQIAILVVVVGVVVVGAWYLRSRNAAKSPDDLEFERERQDAAAASEEVKTEAMVLRNCPTCNTPVDASATRCPQCGYKFT